MQIIVIAHMINANTIMNFACFLRKGFSLWVKKITIPAIIPTIGDKNPRMYPTSAMMISFVSAIISHQFLGLI